MNRHSLGKVWHRPVVAAILRPGTRLDQSVLSQDGIIKAGVCPEGNNRPSEDILTTPTAKKKVIVAQDFKPPTSFLPLFPHSLSLILPLSSPTCHGYAEALPLPIGRLDPECVPSRGAAMRKRAENRL
ncbi:hypothetical protein EYF80_037222 [Liparis tanakae]|uniref:Uncharacterized protein n=1 Tax=Liparis tanakae TaxID=230148 RepID=A0A4Z2GGA8_9TELE|nr:hypothetical protein EYF80_037222 [Liparis tanakae]